MSDLGGLYEDEYFVDEDEDPYAYPDYEYDDLNDGFDEPEAPEPKVIPYNLVVQEDGTKSITVFVPGKGQKGANSDHPNFDLIQERAEAGDESVIDLFDLALVAGTKFENLTERIAVANGRIYFDGSEIDNVLSNQIVAFIREGEDFGPLVNFYEKLATNPNPGSVEHLYKFIQVNEDKETGAFTVTDDGDFIAYKGVKKDAEGNLQSGSSGTAMVNGEVFVGQIPNPVGAVVTMPREQVVFDPDNHCSVGLHVGTFPYAESYGRNGAMLKVRINPRDVVSVPNDSAEKMRVCRYEILEVIDAPETTLVEKTENLSAKDVTEAQQAALDDIRLGDVFVDTDKRRQSEKKVIEIRDNTVLVESKNMVGLKTKREIGKARLLSRKYKRVRRGRKS